MGYFYILLAATLWSLLGPVARVALQEGITPLEIAIWRCIIAWVLFVGHTAIVTKHLPRGSKVHTIRREDFGGIIAFGTIGIAGLYASLPLAVQAGGVALAVVLLYTAPAWVAVFAWGLFKERLGMRKLVALVLTLLGIGGIAMTGNSGSIRPSAAALGWGLISGISYASMYLFGKRYFVRYAPATVFFYALPIAALVLFPLTDFHPPSPTAWSALLVIGICSTYGAYLAYSAGLARLEMTQAAIVATAEPVIAAALAFVFWGERFAPLGYGAAALVLLGVLLIASEPEGKRQTADRRVGSASVP